MAEVYPSFDFASQGLVYEKPDGPGYVSTWHDACLETRELALAYDRVYDALRQDGELVAFLAQDTFAEVQRRIEDGILRDPLRDTAEGRPDNRHKIMCNYPHTDIALVLLEMVLDWPADRAEVLARLDPVIERTTAADGVTGEKGLSGYSSFAIQALAPLLEMCASVDEGLVAELFARHPGLRQTFRFHIDTWCLRRYYPQVGDCGWFASPQEKYEGLRLEVPGPAGGLDDPTVSASMHSLLWHLYQLTGDAAYVQVLYRANGERTAGLPYDLFAADPETVEREVAQVVAREGSRLQLASVNKERWHLAILRAGRGEHERAAWLHYERQLGHGHSDGLNLGLFAKGLDLLPDFGYPPVNYGGWSSERARWYKMAAAHNLVVVDGQDQAVGAGTTTLWAEGEQFRAVRVSAPSLIGGGRYERTVALVDISEEDAYLVDIFRVAGGQDHAKFVHGHFGRVTTHALSLSPAADYGHGTLMRDFRSDPAPGPGWSADWAVEDRYGLRSQAADVHLRYTDLTEDVQAYTCEAWVLAGMFDKPDETWIPRVMVRRCRATGGDGPLHSTFVAVLEPYEGAAKIARIRRLPLASLEGATWPESWVALEIELSDGRRDLLIAADADSQAVAVRLPPGAAAGVLLQEKWQTRLAGELCLVRRDAAGRPLRVAMCHGTGIEVDGTWVAAAAGADFTEVEV